MIIDRNDATVNFKKADASTIHEGSSISALRPNQIIGHYHISGELARGGMGIIYLGYDTKLNREVAIKSLLNRHNNRDYFLDLFRIETQFLGHLQHPNIIPIYESIHDLNGTPYIVMPRIRGRSLLEALAQRTNPAVDQLHWLNIFLQAVNAIAYAHDNGVIHCDLKPSNIMIGDHGEVLLMDWGTAKLLDEQSQAPIAENDLAQHCLEHTGMMGTPGYMAPEQTQVGAMLDQRTDIFGLGSILYEILTGYSPYVANDIKEYRRLAADGDQRDTLARLKVHCTETMLIDIVAKCLKPNRAERYATAQEVSAAIESYLTSLECRAQSNELLKVAAETKAKEEVKRRRVLLVASFSIMACLILMMIGYTRESQFRQKEITFRQSAIREIEHHIEYIDIYLKNDDIREARQVIDRCDELIHLLEADDKKGRLRQALDQRRRELQFLSGISQIRTKACIARANGESFAECESDFRGAYSALGIELNLDQAHHHAAYIRGSVIVERILEGMYEWSSFIPPGSDRDCLFEILTYADLSTSELRALMRDAATVCYPGVLLNRAANLSERKLSPADWISLYHWLSSYGHNDDAVRILEKQIRTQHRSFQINLILALEVSKQPNRWADTYRYFHVANSIGDKNLLLLPYFVNELAKNDEADEAKAMAEDCLDANSVRPIEQEARIRLVLALGHPWEALLLTSIQLLRLPQATNLQPLAAQAVAFAAIHLSSGSLITVPTAYNK